MRATMRFQLLRPSRDFGDTLDGLETWGRSIGVTCHFKSVQRFPDEEAWGLGPLTDNFDVCWIFLIVCFLLGQDFVRAAMYALDELGFQYFVASWRANLIGFADLGCVSFKRFGR